LAYWIKRERAQAGTLTLVPVSLSQPGCTGDLILRGARGWHLHYGGPLSQDNNALSLSCAFDFTSS